MHQLSEEIKQLALSCGFSACGIAKATPMLADAEHLASWIAAGYSADLNYMQQHDDLRTNPQQLVEGTRSIIVVLMNYYTDAVQPSTSPQIAKYAWGTDYHFVMKQYLNQLLTKINTLTLCQGRSFCDSAPIFERSLAVKAGLGWIGKSGMLINPTFGSYCFIGELFVNIDLEEDTPIPSRCGTCQACLQVCPTKALNGHCLNACKCLSYQTIERRSGTLTDDVVKQADGLLFGCDVCVKACPWNKHAIVTNIPELQPNSTLLNMTFDDWENLTSGEFKRRFHSSPLQRAGLRKLKERLRQMSSQR